MGGKNCYPEFEKSGASTLPLSIDAALNGRTRRMRRIRKHDLDYLSGLMNNVHLGDPILEGYSIRCHRGHHHRHKGLRHRSPDHNHIQPDTYQEDDGNDIHQRTRMGTLDGRCHRVIRHGHRQLNGADAWKGRKGAHHETLTGRSKHGALHRRRLAHHMRRIHHHRHNHKEAAAVLESHRTALKEEINQSCESGHGRRGPVHKGHHRVHHRHRKGDISSTNDDTSSTNDDTPEANGKDEDTSSSEQSEDHPRLNERQLTAIALANIHRYHNQRSFNLRTHFPRLPGRRSNRHRFTIPVSLATPAVSDCPTYDNETFLRTNYYHSPRVLFRHVRRGRVLEGGQVAAIYHGRHRRFMHSHHHM